MIFCCTNSDCAYSLQQMRFCYLSEGGVRKHHRRGDCTCRTFIAFPRDGSGVVAKARRPNPTSLELAAGRDRDQVLAAILGTTEQVSLAACTERRGSPRTRS